VFDIWSFTKKADGAVIIAELADQVSIMDASSDIVINYTIRAPIKSGYVAGDYVPMKLYYWFINNNTGQCESQFYATHSATPYCDPLMVEVMGRVEQDVSFVANLHPTLYKDNEYAIVREVWIDPIEDGQQRWVKYASGHIGNVLVVEDTGAPEGEAIISEEAHRNKYLAGIIGICIICYILYLRKKSMEVS
jgi:hypothetical protein